MLPQHWSSHFAEVKPQGHFDGRHSFNTLTQRKQTHEVYYLQIPVQGCKELGEGQSSIPGHE